MEKKSIIITLHISELLYDVSNKTWLTGRSRDIGENFKEVAYMQATEDDEGKRQILRSFGNALSYIRSLLSEYIDVGCCSTGTNILMDEDDVEIALNMPSNFNEAATSAIATAMHQYLANTAIGDWFLITNKADAAEYVTQAATNITEIKEAIYQRVRPTRPINR